MNTTPPTPDSATTPAPAFGDAPTTTGAMRPTAAAAAIDPRLAPTDLTYAPSRRAPDAAQFAHIPGWGADLDPADRPAVPKERLPARPVGAHWDRPSQQPRHVQVLVSAEHRAITPVFGSTVPPRGTSGRMREAAFRWSENDLRHWLILLAADRLDMVEGVWDDLRRGHVPNVFAEMGLASEWRHNRPAAIRKLALAAGVLVAVGVYRARRRR